MQNLFGYTTKENVSAHMDFETLNAIKEDIIGELHSTIGYDTNINMTSSDTLKKAWTQIRNDELMHIGMLIGLLCYYDVNFKEHFNHGIEQSENIINKK